MLFRLSTAPGARVAGVPLCQRVSTWGGRGVLQEVLNFCLIWMARLESHLQMNYILFTVCVWVCVRMRARA